MWWWATVAAYAVFFYCLYRALRLPFPAVLDVPVILSTRVILMADTVEVGTTLLAPTGAPADGSVPSYRCVVTAGTAAPTSTDLPIAQAPPEIVQPPNVQVTVTYAPIGITGSVGQASSPLIFTTEVPPPDVKLDKPQIASTRVIVTPAAPPA